MNKSEAIEKLAEALAAAQGQIVAAVKDKVNPHFKSRYADLASVWDACRGPLSSHGLSVAQTTRGGESGGVVLVTTLFHSSGQWIAGELPIHCDTKSPQAIGSAITYARRYGLAAIVGVCPEDDDGEAAVEQQRGQRPGKHRDRDRREFSRPSRPEPEGKIPPRDDGPPATMDAGSATKIARRFEESLNAFCRRMNAAWADRHTSETGEIPGWVRDLANPYQIVGHMLKEAGVETPKGGNFNERMRAASKLWAADEAGTVAEWKAYVKRLALETEQEHAGTEEPAAASVNGREPGEDG